MTNVLDEKFFNRPTVDVAKGLVGNFLVRNYLGKNQHFIITETEAYVGPQDKACHAYKGRTQRTEIMFGSPGRFYVYLVYGMYWMLNVVTEHEGYPAAVLIRGAGEWNGPGKVTKSLGVDKSFNGKIALPETGLWFEKAPIDTIKIKSTPRIGVDYAGEWAKKPYRFLISNF